MTAAKKQARSVKFQIIYITKYINYIYVYALLILCHNSVNHIAEVQVVSCDTPLRQLNGLAPNGTDHNSLCRFTFSVPLVYSFFALLSVQFNYIFCSFVRAV